jgi:hypothetical protein
MDQESIARLNPGQIEAPARCPAPETAKDVAQRSDCRTERPVLGKKRMEPAAAPADREIALHLGGEAVL